MSELRLVDHAEPDQPVNRTADRIHGIAGHPRERELRGPRLHVPVAGPLCDGDGNELRGWVNSRVAVETRPDAVRHELGIVLDREIQPGGGVVDDAERACGRGHRTTSSTAASLESARSDCR